VTTQDPHRQKALVVTDKAERVWRFHENTLHALKELVQAAGLNHPCEITASHIVRRIPSHEVRLLVTLLGFVAPGALIEAIEGRTPWPHKVFEQYWPLSRSDSFQPVALPMQKALEPTA
jgi:hypothetical protein